MKFDELLEEIGEFGPYQKRIFVLVSLITIVSALITMSPVFLLEIPNYRCALPYYSNDTYAIQNDHHQHLINISIPLVTDSQGETTYSKCSLYNKTDDRPEGNATEYDCAAWVYDTSVIQTSGITDFNMVCKDEILRSHSNMMSFAGGFPGSVVFGPLSDGIGRKKTLLLSILLTVATSVAAAVSPNYEVYVISVFSNSFASLALFMVAFVIVMEVVGPSKRIVVGILIEFFWVAGLFLLSGLAYLLREWRHLRLAIGIPPVIFLVYWWCTINIMYYGVSLNVGNLSGDIYVNFFLSSVMELIAFAGSLFFLNRAGRKPLLCVSQLIGGLSCLLTIFPVLYGDTSTYWTLVGLSMVGKLGSSAAFAIIFIYAAELFPTVVRQSGLALCTMSGMLGAMVAPYIADLGLLVKGQLADALPLIVFGALAITAGIMLYILPETRNQVLPETIGDAIAFGKSRKNTCETGDEEVIFH